MKKKRNAILLSALVFPGLGQIFLKRYKTAVLIILATVTAFIQFMNIVMRQADAAVNRIMAQGGPLDMQAISEAASQSAAGTASYTIYLWIMFICWFVSLLDILFIDRKHR